MARYKGKAISKITYNVTDYRPLDTRMLVPTYADLTLESNWLYNNSSIAYNGMIVAVGEDSDASLNGVYYLFDPTPDEDEVPHVTHETNWHKLCELDDLSSVVSQLSSLEQSIEDLFDRVAALESASNDNIHTYGYRSLFPEIGEAGHMYVAADLQRTYVYVEDTGYMLVGTGFEETESGEILIYGGSADDEEN